MRAVFFAAALSSILALLLICEFLSGEAL